MIYGSDAGFRMLTEKITRDRGFRCASYKDKCLRRRIAVRMRAKGTATPDEYAGILDTDPHEYERLMRSLTVNVTKFFRNWETYEAIQSSVIPALWDRDEELKVWSAGCASGEEPYSLAILFDEHAVEQGEQLVLRFPLEVDDDVAANEETDRVYGRLAEKIAVLEPDEAAHLGQHRVKAGHLGKISVA